MTEPAELTYAAAMEELETIVRALDEGAIDIDSLSAEFQRAIDIVEDLHGRIARTQAQVDALAPRLDAIRNSGAAENG